MLVATAFAVDYSTMTIEELAKLRGKMQNVTVEERNAFQNEWQKRIQTMAQEDRQKYIGKSGIAGQCSMMQQKGSLRHRVESVDKITPMRGMYYGIHLMVKTDKETIAVDLGPGWYIERLDTKIENGDKVEVKGSRVTFAGKPAIIAAEVKKGDNVLTLRDNTDIPAWSGWRR
jgi:hypothetical protein